jgi:hypothetical protein
VRETNYTTDPHEKMKINANKHKRTPREIHRSAAAAKKKTDSANDNKTAQKNVL